MSASLPTSADSLEGLYPFMPSKVTIDIYRAQRPYPYQEKEGKKEEQNIKYRKTINYLVLIKNR